MEDLCHKNGKTLLKEIVEPQASAVASTFMEEQFSMAEMQIHKGKAMLAKSQWSYIFQKWKRRSLNLIPYIFGVAKDSNSPKERGKKGKKGKGKEGNGNSTARGLLVQGSLSHRAADSADCRDEWRDTQNHGQESVSQQTCAAQECHRGPRALSEAEDTLE